MVITPNLVRRFWNCVSKPESCECWVWSGAKARGYGKFRSGPRIYQAHVASWNIHIGPVPDGHVVMHNCPGGDRRDCVNPAHLMLGTQQMNMKDMVAKGRSTKGKPKAGKLTDDIVRSIRQQRQANVPYVILRELYHVSDQTIWRIAKGIDYRHVS